MVGVPGCGMGIVGCNLRIGEVAYAMVVVEEGAALGVHCGGGAPAVDQG